MKEKVAKFFKFIRTQSRANRSRETTWGFHRGDALGYFDFDGDPFSQKCKQVVLKRLRERKKAGKKNVYLDLCGQADLTENTQSKDLVDRNYSMTLWPQNRVHLENKDKVGQLGVDVTDSRQFDNAVDYIREKEGKVSFVTLEAVEGLGSYSLLSTQSKESGLSGEQITGIFTRMFLRRMLKLREIAERGTLFYFGRNNSTWKLINNVFDNEEWVKQMGYRVIFRKRNRILFEYVG